MEALAILMLIFLPIGLVIWLIVRAILSRQAISELRARQQWLEGEVALLQRQLASGEAAIPARPTPSASPQASAGPDTGVVAKPPGSPTPTPAPAAALGPVPPPLPAAAFAAAAPAPRAPSPSPAPRIVPGLTHVDPLAAATSMAPPTIPVPQRPRINWEQFVGVKLFAWLGGFALFLAAAFGLKYSFEHDLISPALRVTLGFVLGGGLVGGGIWLRRREYAVTSQTLCAVGVVILYAVTFACHSLYRFAAFSLPVTFGLMALITAGAFLLAVRLDAQVVAVLGLLGGFLTPALVSTGEDNPGGLFSYLALLDAGLIGIARRRRWDYLLVLAAVGTIVMQFGWLAKFFEPEKFFIAEAVLLGFSGLFVGAFAWAQRRDWFNGFVLAAAIMMPVVALTVSFDFVTDPGLKLQPGRVFSLVFGADLLLLAIVVLRPQARAVGVVAGALSFLLLSTWTVNGLNAASLPWALGLYLGFAVLHTVFPIVLTRLHPRATTPAWCQLFPGVALLLLILPLLQRLTLPWSFWPVVLMIDLLALGMALRTRSLLGLLVTLAVTLLTTAVWLFEFPATPDSLAGALVVIGGFGIFFVAAVVFALGKGASPGAPGGAPARPERNAWETLFDRGGTERALAGLPAVLPFLLLTTLTLQLRPANPSPIFGVGLFLLLVVAVLVWWTRLDALLAAGLAAGMLLEATWQTSSLVAGPALGPLAWHLAFYALFLLFPFVAWRRFEAHRVVWITAAVSGPLHFFLVHRLVKIVWMNDAMGVIPAAFAVPSFVALFWLKQRLAPESPQRLHHLAWFGGVALFFVTLVFPVQFDREWLTIGWALEGVALLWLFHRVPHPGLRLAGTGLLITAFVRLALNPTVLGYHPRSSTPILNWYLYTYGIVTVALFAGAWLLAPPRERVLGSNARAVLTTLGTVLAFVLVNVEVADYFASGPALTFEFSGNIARDMTYTIAWAVFAFVLVTVGILRELRAVRYAGIGLLGVTLLKLFLHDLARLNQLYRIGAFVAVAVIAILASVLYQRFLAKETRSAGG